MPVDPREWAEPAEACRVPSPRMPDLPSLRTGLLVSLPFLLPCPPAWSSGVPASVRARVPLLKMPRALYLPGVWWAFLASAAHCDTCPPPPPTPALFFCLPKKSTSCHRPHIQGSQRSVLPAHRSWTHLPPLLPWPVWPWLPLTLSLHQSLAWPSLGTLTRSRLRTLTCQLPCSSLRPGRFSVHLASTVFPDRLSPKGLSEGLGNGRCSVPQKLPGVVAPAVLSPGTLAPGVWCPLPPLLTVW